MNEVTKIKKKILTDMHLLAKAHNGKCRAHEYINSITKLEWECEIGHTWFATPSSIQQGSWCPECVGLKKKNITDMHLLAKAHNGKCLSHEYINSTTKLEWECENGHIWKARPSHIRQGTWCPECVGKKKKTLINMQELAKAHNGKCLSHEYINCTTKLEWECENGHIWKARPTNIQQGSWCPECGGSKKKNLSDMITLAKTHNGKCLSHEYINSNTKLEWECEKNHTWYAKPCNIQQGTWCPNCAKQKKKKKI